jgi:hypothetical protein
MVTAVRIRVNIVIVHIVILEMYSRYLDPIKK